MQKLTNIALVLSLTATLSATAFAASCRPTPSNLDESFGVGQLGQPYAELLPAIKPVPPGPHSDNRCYNLDDTSYDCQFTDDKGISYEDEGTGLSMKGIFVLNAPNVPLPFGLTFQDKVRDVIKKTRTYRRREFRIVREGADSDYVSGLCYMNARGKKFSLNFSFENGILVGLYVESEDATPRDPSQ